MAYPAVTHTVINPHFCFSHMVRYGIFVIRCSAIAQTQESACPKRLRDVAFLKVGPAVSEDSPSLRVALNRQSPANAVLRGSSEVHRTVPLTSCTLAESQPQISGGTSPSSSLMAVATSMLSE